MLSNKELLEVLLYQRKHRVEDSIYKIIQCDFAYSSNQKAAEDLVVLRETTTQVDLLEANSNNGMKKGRTQ